MAVHTTVKHFVQLKIKSEDVVELVAFTESYEFRDVHHDFININNGKSELIIRTFNSKYSALDAERQILNFIESLGE